MLCIRTYCCSQDSTFHPDPPEGDPPPGCTWEADERDVEIENGRVKAVVVWGAVEGDEPDSPFKLDGSVYTETREERGGGDKLEAVKKERDELQSALDDIRRVLQENFDTCLAGIQPAGVGRLLQEKIDELVERRDDRIEDLEQAYEGTRSELRRVLDEIDTLLSDVFDVDATDATLDKAIRELGDQVEILKADKNDLEGRIRGENQSLKGVLSNIFDACNQYLDDDYQYEEADDAVAETIQTLENQRDTAIEALTGPPEDEGGDEPDTEGPDDQSIKACIDDVPVDRYTWQPASDLAERLDTTPQVIGMTAARYEEGQDTKWPIERRQTTSGKEYRIEPGESPFSGHFVYLIGPEVPDGMTPEQTCESEAEAKKEAASHKTEKDPDDYKPPVVRVERARTDVPEMHETLTWDAIDGDEGMEVVQ